jgi:ADP-ribose pyrophosphatase YjhB (NUDIX family)
VKEHTENSKHKVEELIEDLRNCYGDFEVADKTWHVSKDDFETELQNFREGGYGGTGIWLTNEEGQVLLVRNKDDDSWGDPGGHHENGESFEEAALRETKEETNVEAEITGIQSVDRVKLKHEETGDRLFNLLVIFKGKYISGEPEPQEEEIAELKWWGEHPENLLYEDLKQFTIPKQ